MNKFSATFSFFLFVFLSVQAQQGQWTWMKGDNTPNQPGVYGTQGVADPLNNPPAIYGPARWTDLQGNLWIFSGVVGNGLTNDLWKYDASINQWTWMKGPGTPNDNGSYGTIGVPSPTNNPGARGYGSASWTDTSGNLWLFGGTGYGGLFSGALADLWRYNPSTNEWTWMKGDPNDNSDFGTLQIPASSNTPGMRDECTANWVDVNGNLWLYGSKRDNSVLCGNDMWQYDIGLNQWIWMSGSNGNNAVPPSYGTQNIFSASNTPGSRMNHCGWSVDGNFWLYGGWEIFGDQYGDLWEYDPAINQWAWISGSDIGYPAGIAGNQCDTSSAFFPGYLFENRASYVDSYGNLWLFGGVGTGDFNDMWVYQPNCHVWSLVKGTFVPNQPGVYGTIGVPDPANIPAGRMGMGSFQSSPSEFWVFGGRATNASNDYSDLWKFVVDPSCASYQPCNSLVNFLASQTDVCEKFCIDFSDASLNNPISWLWTFEGGNPFTSTDQNPNICYDVPGTYDVTLIATSASGNDTLTLIDFITVYPTPPIPTITQNGLTLTSTTGASYQWQLNSVDIPAATNQSYEVTQTGLYTVIVSDSNGCVNSATLFVEITGIGELHETEFLIYPNPSSGIVFMITKNIDAGEIKVFNSIGRQVNPGAFASSISEMKIEFSEQPNGVYFIQIKNSDKVFRKKIVITR